MNPIADQQSVEFVSASTAGVVNVMLGFIPDWATLIVNHTGTNPLIYRWFNNAYYAGWPATQTIVDTGSSGILTLNTASAITVFNGGTVISTVETAASDPKHIDAKTGAFVVAAEIPYVTPVGLAIIAAIQVNNGRNMLTVFRNSR